LLSTLLEQLWQTTTTLQIYPQQMQNIFQNRQLINLEVRNDGRAAELEPCLSTQFYKIMEKVHL